MQRKIFYHTHCFDPLGKFFEPTKYTVWSMDPNITDGEAFVVLTAVMVEHREKVSIHLECPVPWPREVCVGR